MPLLAASCAEQQQGGIKMNRSTRIRKRTLFLTQFAMLLIIEALFCFTILGSIPIGPIVATTAHIPVIITAILLGTKAGALMGLAMGLFSVYIWTYMIPPTSSPFAFVFSPFVSGNIMSFFISVVPRVMIGVAAGLIFKLFYEVLGKNRVSQGLAYGMAGVLGSLANTVLVLGGIYLFFGHQFAEASGLAYDMLLGTLMGIVVSNGLPELIVASVAAYTVGMPLKEFLNNRYL